MKKQLFMLNFVFALAAFNTMHADIDTNMFYDETDEKAQWELVEKAFITDIGRSKQLCWRHLEVIIPAIIGSAAAYKTLEVYSPYFSYDSQKGLWDIQNPRVHCPIIAATMGAILVYQYAQCYIENIANRNAIKNFFTNYEENQFFVPAELQDAFDMIMEKIEQDGMDLVLADANEYVDVIQGIVMRHFESRYKSVLDAKGRDVLAESKTVIENFKNFFDGATKIK